MDEIETLKQALSEVVEYTKHLAEEITEIKVQIMDNLINPIKDEYEKMEHDNALSDFRCKHAEKLEGFNDKLKAIEGEDFDIVEKAFDDFRERTDGMAEDEYVDELANKVQEQLDAIASAFGVPAEKIEEVKIETENGEAEAKVEDGEVVSVEGETAEVVEDEPAEADETTKAETDEVAAEETEKAETDEPAEDDSIDWEEEFKKVGGKSKSDFLRV